MAKNPAGQGELPRAVGFEKEALLNSSYLFKRKKKKCFFLCAIHEFPAHGIVDKTQFPVFNIKPPSSTAGGLFLLLSGTDFLMYMLLDVKNEVQCIKTPAVFYQRGT